MFVGACLGAVHKVGAGNFGLNAVFMEARDFTGILRGTGVNTGYPHALYVDGSACFHLALKPPSVARSGRFQDIVEIPSPK